MHHEFENTGTSATDDSEETFKQADAYPFKLDAVVLAGTHQNPKRLIAGRNKAFLEVGGQVLIRYVINALVEAKTIDKIFVVGPYEELSDELADYPPEVQVIAQRGKMLTNCWAGMPARRSMVEYGQVLTRSLPICHTPPSQAPSFPPERADMLIKE